MAKVPRRSGDSVSVCWWWMKAAVRGENGRAFVDDYDLYCAETSGMNE